LSQQAERLFVAMVSAKYLNAGATIELLGLLIGLLGLHLSLLGVHEGLRSRFGQEARGAVYC
jgi:hypothetical protein